VLYYWDNNTISKVHCPVMIVVAGYLITIALGELFYLNSSPG